MKQPGSISSTLDAVDRLNELKHVLAFYADAVRLFSEAWQYKNEAYLNPNGAAFLGLWMDEKLKNVMDFLEKEEGAVPGPSQKTAQNASEDS